MNLLLRAVGATILFLLLSASTVWRGLLDSNAVFCIDPDPNYYGHKDAWKLFDNGVENYVFTAKSDKITLA